jgi:AcrR family transcriptional regulator
LRERIIETVMELMEEVGIKFTMSDLAARLAVSKSTIYEYFHSKEELISTIVDSVLDNYVQQVKKIINDENLTVIDKIESFQLVYPQYGPSFIGRILSDIGYCLPEEKKKIERCRQGVWELYEGVIQKGIADNCFRPVNPAVIQMLFNAMTNLLFNQKFLIKNNLTMRDFSSIAMDLLLNGLVVPEKRQKGS